MRRPASISLSLLSVILGVAPLAFTQGPVNPRLPPPPPPPAEEFEAPPVAPRRLVSLIPAQLPAAPQTVTLLAGTRIDVVLDTPLSTRISKAGHPVAFRTSNPLPLEGGLELPPETVFSGKVVRVKRPGAFARSGELRVVVERIELGPADSSPVIARLDSPDSQHGRIRADSNRTFNLYNLGLWTLQGTLAGTQLGGGKGAGIGAGAGAAIGLIILMSQRGPDVYLEPGMPFLILLDEAVDLPGAAVQAAQEAHSRAYGLDPQSENLAGSEPGSADAKPGQDPDRPVLKRRPKNSVP